MRTRCQVTYWLTACILIGAHVGIASSRVASAGFGVSAGRIISYSISPGGSSVAEVEVGGAVAGPKEHIVVRDLEKPALSGRTIFVGRGIGRIYWITAHNILFVQAAGSDAIVLENVQTGARRTVFKTKRRISIVAFDRSGRRVAYAYSVPWRWDHRASVRVTDAMSVEELIAPVWARWPTTEVVGAVKLGDLNTPRVARRIRLRRHRFSGAVPPTFAWRRGQLLVVTSSMHSLRSRIFDVEDGRRIDRAMPLFRLLSLSVSRTGQLAVLSTGLWKDRSTLRCGCNGRLRLYVLHRGGAVTRISAMRREGYVEDVSGLWWAGRGRLFAQVMGFKGRGGAMRWWLEEIDTRTNRVIRTYHWPSGDLGGGAHACDFDIDRTKAICIGQSLTTPPVLVEVNLANGAMQVLGRVNPAAHRLHFTFRTVRVSNGLGFYSTAFLAVPREARTRPVPLAVMAYGFSEAYSRDAQWITSYPVAKLVHAGIAVLLVNWARLGVAGLHLSPFALTKRALESAVTLFANAVPAVRAAGVRVSRAMVMGWSFGGLFAAHAIQSLHEYVAAQVGDPAAYNVTQYGLGNAFWRYISGWYFGGPPVGRYLKRYRYIDPAGDGKPAQGPILFEFVSRSPDAGQYLEEWRAVGTDVEAFAYRKSVHWLSVPAEARISRLRNLYWAKLNLLGPRSVTSAQLTSVGLSVPAKGWWNAKGLRQGRVRRRRGRGYRANGASTLRPQRTRTRERVSAR